MIWERVFAQLPSERAAMNQKLVSLDPDSRTAFFASGLQVHYRHLITSVPLPQLLKLLP